MTNRKSRRKLMIILIAIPILMFGFGFALVPLYQVFCKVTGLNGKVYGQASASDTQVVDQSRTIKVLFVANKNESLPWDFYPLVKQIEIHPGESKKIFYYAKNPTKQTMTIQAVPSISPGIASQYLKKTECFCFTQQTFKAGQSLKMPVIFRVDDDLPKDISTIILSYTLFDVNASSHPIQKQGRIQ